MPGTVLFNFEDVGRKKTQVLLFTPHEEHDCAACLSYLFRVPLIAQPSVRIAQPSVLIARPSVLIAQPSVLIAQPSVFEAT